MIRTLAVLAVLAGTAHADPRNAVIADVGLHVVGLGYQRTVTPHVALQLCAESYTPWTHETNFFDAQGYLVRARPFYYVTAAPRGLWISPFAQIGVVSSDQSGRSESAVAFAIGASVGYAWLVRDHFHILIGAGLQYDRARIADQSQKPSFSGFWPQLDGSLGWAF